MEWILKKVEVKFATRSVVKVTKKTVKTKRKETEKGCPFKVKLKKKVKYGGIKVIG